MSLAESLNDALVDCVKACGGSKPVAHALWPSKPLDAAQRHLLACLNESKPERLCPDDMLLLLRMARDRGCHVGMQYIAHALSYAEPVPIEPRDELADLIRQYISRKEQEKADDSRIERLLEQQLRVRAA